MICLHEIWKLTPHECLCAPGQEFWFRLRPLSWTCWGLPLRRLVAAVRTSVEKALGRDMDSRNKMVIYIYVKYKFSVTYSSLASSYFEVFIHLVNAISSVSNYNSYCCRDWECKNTVKRRADVDVYLNA